MIKLKNERKHGELYDVFYEGYYIGDIAKNVQKEYFYFLPRAVQVIELTSECLKELANRIDDLNNQENSEDIFNYVESYLESPNND